MCLTWCHARELVYDNDLACSGCPAYGSAVAADGTPRSCSTCRHRQPEGENGPWCALTTMPLPYAEFCCHHNVTPSTREVIPLDAVTVAPWVLDHFRAASVAVLFDEHHSAPDVETVGSTALLRLDSLARPFLYGVTADAWDDCLAVPPPPPIPEPPPHLDLTLAVLEALQRHEDVATPKAALLAMLEEHPLDDVHPYWRGTISETLALVEEHERAE